MRMMLDTLAVLDDDAKRLRERYCFQPMMRPGEMRNSFAESGLTNIEETSLLIRMEYESFDDYWEPISAGEGPLGQYVAALAAQPRGTGGRHGSRRLRGRSARRSAILRLRRLGLPGPGSELRRICDGSRPAAGPSTGRRR
jgi:hypothetical protein